MNEARHTPGPWSINDWPQPDTSIAIGAEGTPLIARVMLRDVSINEQKANARLIAVAPELLQTLKEVVPQLEYMASGMTHAPRKTKEAQECLERVLAVIAKASGGQA